MWKLSRRPGMQRQRPVRLRRRLVPERLLQRKLVRPVRVAIGLSVWRRRRGMRRVRVRTGVHERRVHVRRRLLLGVLQRFDVRAFGGRVDRLVRLGRCNVQSLLGRARVQHERGPVRLRRDLVPERVLQRRIGRHVRAVRVRVERLVRRGGRDLRRLRLRPAVQQERRSVRV